MNSLLVFQLVKGKSVDKVGVLQLKPCAERKGVSLVEQGIS